MDNNFAMIYVRILEEYSWGTDVYQRYIRCRSAPTRAPTAAIRPLPGYRTLNTGPLHPRRHFRKQPPATSRQCQASFTAAAESGLAEA